MNYRWEGLPAILASEIKSFSRKDMKNPLFCLNLVLRQAITDVENIKKVSELTSKEEIIKLIRLENPDNFYEHTELIYQSFCSEGVFRTYCKETGKPFIMKVTKESLAGDNEIDRLKSEVFILMSIDSRYVLKPKEIFCYDDKLIILSEEMDHGSMESVIKYFFKDELYTERFCKYLLYHIAMGIRDLH